MKNTFAMLGAVAALVFAGCSSLPSYRWTSRVPDHLRTIRVPTFENRTMSAELGPIVTQFVSREFQREGTFSLARASDAAIEVQGAIIKAENHGVAFDRGYGMRASEYRYLVTAEVSIINRRTGDVLQNNRRYTAETTFLVKGDLLTGRRDAAQRIAADLARQIVDDVISYPYNKPVNQTGTEPVG